MNEDLLLASINEHYASLRSAAAAARSAPFQPASESGILDVKLTHPLQLRQPQNVAAVDGGVLAGELHGAAVVLSRAAGVLLTYEGDALKKTRYEPNRDPRAELALEYGLDAVEFTWFKGLERLRAEIRLALTIAEKHAPELLLLDGSIIPQTADKPRGESKLAESYTDVISLYQKLFDACRKRGVLLAGVNKDSRGRAALGYLEKAVPALEPFHSKVASWTDSLFLSQVLREGERSFAFRYTKAKEIHPVMRDLGAWSEAVCSLYLRPSATDRPLRVDYLNPALLEGDAAKANAATNEIANKIFALCRVSARYAYPAALVEADLRAALNPLELERTLERLASKAGRENPFLLSLRRNDRPFR